jgi:hypothetical protein
MSTAGWGRRARLLIVAAALPLLYQVFRMGYYGVLVATPAIAKEGSRLRPAHGWSYLRNFVEPYVLVIPLLAVLLAIAGPMVRQLMARGDHRALATIGVVAGSGIVSATYVVLVGGDYVHARLLMPALFAVLAPWFVVAASVRYLEGIVVTFAWAVLCVVALRPAASAPFDLDADGDGTYDLWQFTVGYHGRSLTTEDRGFAERGPAQPWIDGGGLYLGNVYDSGGTPTGIAVADADAVVVATRAVGAMGYALGPEVRIIDLHGLADPLTAHQQLVARWLPGHEKLAAEAWLVARSADDPDAVMPDQLTVAFGPWAPPRPLEFLEQVAWARAALRCDSIEGLLDAAGERLTAGRFMTNIWQAIPNTDLRVSRDPREAFEANCDDVVPDEMSALRARAIRADQPPLEPGVGQLVVIGDCTAVFLGTDRPRGWQVVDAASIAATVRLLPSDSQPRLAALWVVGRYHDAMATTWVETDGTGRYRIRVDVPWLPPVLQAWTKIPDDGVVEVAIAPDIDTAQWVVLAAGAELARMPMAYTEWGVTAATVPASAGPSSTAGSISVIHDPPERSEACRSILTSGDVET